jgi:hypothetical protein
MLFVFNLLLQFLDSRLASSSGGSSRLERISVAELFVESLGRSFYRVPDQLFNARTLRPVSGKGRGFFTGETRRIGRLEPIKTGRISCSDTRTNPWDLAINPRTVARRYAQVGRRCLRGQGGAPAYPLHAAASG